MVNYYVKRTGKAALTMYIVVTLTFALIRLLPGGPISTLASFLEARGFTEEQIQGTISAIKEVGFNPDAPLWEQYITYLNGIAHGSLGQSIRLDLGEPVTPMVANALPWTVLLAVTSIIIFFVISITLGAIMAYKEGSTFDTINSGIAMTFSGVPFFVMGLVILYIFGYQLGWFPTQFKHSLKANPGFSVSFMLDVAHHAVLPITSIVLARYGVRALAMRGNSISELGKGYVEVAKLRGLSSRTIALRYVGRNAVLPMYTGMLLAFGWILGGTVILEEIYTYQGLGLLMLRALNNSDYPVLMATFMIITLALVVGIYLADLTYGLVDPRIKSGDESEAF